MNKKLMITISVASIMILTTVHIDQNDIKTNMVAKSIIITAAPKLEIPKTVVLQTNKVITIAKPEVIKPKGIDDYIKESSVNNDLPEGFIRAVIKAESDFRVDCVGPDTQYGNAFGLMQLLPSTAKEVGIVDLYNPQQNIEGGTRYLKQLYDMYNNKDILDQNGHIVTPYELAAIAYNWGFDNLDKHIKKYGFVVIAKDSKYAIPKETFIYVTKINSDFDFNQYFD